MTKLAVCGLGLLGGPIATRLVDAGHDVTVWNRTPEKTKPLVERGASRASTPAVAADGADVAITILSTSEAVEEVVFGAGGLAEGLPPGSLLVDMSTIGPDAVSRMATKLPDGIEMVDSPVLGSVPQATDGTLKVFVGGSDEAYARVEPLLRTLGAPRHIGPLGSGAAMKLVVNSTLGPLVGAFGEAMKLGDALGLDQSAVLDVLAESSIGVTVKGKRERVVSGVYEPSFTLAMALKDSGLVLDAAERRAADLPLAETVRRLLAAAEQDGLGDLDYSALVAHIRGTPASGSPGGA
jgi:3-hydroxyisobutyrate dehydrogenase-like beta-hydroxyacid dehydrogenase